MAIKYIIETKSKGPYYWFWKKTDKKEKNRVYATFNGEMFRLVSFSSKSLDKVLGSEKFEKELINIEINDDIELSGKFPSYQKSLIHKIIGYYKAVSVLGKK